MLSIEEYDVDSEQVLGRGSFGVIHRAVDKIGREIAAKRIDFTTKDSENIPEFAKELRKLVGLNHENVARIFDILEETVTIWVFMELCRHGDLVNYLQGDDISHSVAEKFKLMVDIAKGVEYLHSQNVVHRDIKPTNVLVSSFRGFHATAKLTDFDCGKFLKEDYSTSLMTSNIGTQAFKAPEFYLRTEEFRLEYHRNVDIYALGLTFLAIIQNNRFLVPRIETAKDHAEMGPLYTIGMLMAERKRYNVKPLEALQTSTEGGEPLWNAVRREVLKMTHVEPKKRASAADVVRGLTRVAETVSPQPRGPTTDGASPTSGLDSRMTGLTIGPVSRSGCIQSKSWVFAALAMGTMFFSHRVKFS